jgi:hypothetical protein
MTRAEWDAAQAKAIAEVEAERAEQLERILDARCPGSRRGVDERAKHLAAGAVDGPASRVERPLVNGWLEELGYNLPDGLGFE